MHLRFAKICQPRTAIIMLRLDSLQGAAAATATDRPVATAAHAIKRRKRSRFISVVDLANQLEMKKAQGK